MPKSSNAKGTNKPKPPKVKGTNVPNSSKVKGTKMPNSPKGTDMPNSPKGTNMPNSHKGTHMPNSCEVKGTYKPDVSEETKQQLEKRLNKIQQEFLEIDTKYISLLSEYSEKVTLRNELIDKQIELRGKLSEKLSQCIDIYDHQREIERQKVLLERHQQYREETEWKEKLAQLYQKEVEREMHFRQKLEPMEKHCRGLRRKLLKLNRKYAHEKELLEVCHQGLEDVKQQFLELKDRLDEHIAELHEHYEPRPDCCAAAGLKDEELEIFLLE